MEKYIYFLLNFLIFFSFSFKIYLYTIYLLFIDK